MSTVHIKINGILVTFSDLDKPNINALYERGYHFVDGVRYWATSEYVDNDILSINFETSHVEKLRQEIYGFAQNNV